MVQAHQLERCWLLSASVGMALWLVLRGQWGPGVWTMSTLDWVWIVVLAVV